MKQIFSMLVVLIIVAVTPAAADDHFFSYDLIFPDVYLQDGVAADINVLVFNNTDHKCAKDLKGRSGKSIIALHGLANTANTWKPLAKELFSDNPIGQEVCSILAINLPGHGHSGLPEVEAGSPFTFGHLTLDHHAQAVIGTLERIRQAGFHPKTIMAHSQGGLIVQIMQQTLIDEGSSLWAELGIKKVFLMASVAPKGLPWEFAENGTGAAVVSQFIPVDEKGRPLVDPVLGPQVAIPDEAWPFLFFINPENGSMPDNTPFEAVTTEGYNSPEPLYASLQLLGLLGSNGRPWVDFGIFDKTGTKLEYVAMSQDVFQSVDEQEALYMHLTNDSSLKKFAVVNSGNAVHSMYISNPAELLEALVPSKISLP